MIPSSGQKTLSEVGQLELAPPALELRLERALAANLVGRLVVAQALVGRRAQLAVVRPLDELDLADELRASPRRRRPSAPSASSEPGRRVGVARSSGRSLRRSRSISFSVNPVPQFPAQTSSSPRRYGEDERAE